MQSLNENVRVDFLAKHDDAADSSTVSTYLSMEDYGKIMFVGEIGAPGGVWSVMRVLQATDASGTSAKAVTGAAVTTFTNLAAVGERFVIEVDAAQLDKANSFNFVAIDWGVSDATGNNYVDIVSLRYFARFKHRGLNMDVATDVSTNLINVA